MISGKLRIRTPGGQHDVLAGQGFYVEPGHAPEAVEDTEMFEVSPAQQSRELSAYQQELAALPQRSSQREERAPGDRR